MKLRTLPATTWAVPALTVAVACGEDDGPGGSPDLFLGLSGVIIVCIVAWLLLRWMGRS